MDTDYIQTLDLPWFFCLHFWLGQFLLDFSGRFLWPAPLAWGPTRLTLGGLLEGPWRFLRGRFLLRRLAVSLLLWSGGHPRGGLGNCGAAGEAFSPPFRL